MTSTLDFSDRARAPAGLDFSKRSRRVTYFQTDRGPATVTTQPDGSVWLETADGYAGGLDRFSRAEPVFAADPGDTSKGDGSFAGPRSRSLWERFTTTAEDQAYRNPIISIGRRLAPDEVAVGPSLREELRTEERERRALNQMQTEADPWWRAPGGMFPAINRAAAGVATLGGALAGGMSDPVNALGGVGKQIFTRIAGEAAVNAAGDVVSQAADVTGGVEDRYSPAQTLFAAGTVAAFQGAIEGAGPLARATGRNIERGLDFSHRAVSRALPNPLPDFSGRAMDSGPAPRSSGLAAPALSLSAPVSGPVSSGFGPRRAPKKGASTNHAGLDYAVAEGTPVAAAADGEVIYAGPRGNYGNRVVIRHADGTETSYSHLSAIDVKVGDRVRGGQAVAASGSTGNVTGPHLHFEVRQGGRYVDPRGVLGQRLTMGEPDDGSLPQVSAPRARVGAPEDLGPGYREEPAVQGADPATTAERVTAEGPRQPAPGFSETRLAMEAPRVQRAAEVDPSQRPAADFDPTAPDFSARALDPLAAPDATPPEVALRAAAEPLPIRGQEAPEPTAPDFALRATPESLAIDLSAYGERIGQRVEARPASTLRGQPRSSAAAVGEGTPDYAGQTVSQLADRLRKSLGATQRQGRLSSSRAAGEYDVQSGVIRTRAARHAMGVLAHEGGHLLEFKHTPSLKAALAAHEAELRPMAYEGAAPNVIREEGFAEFFRLYLTAPEKARAEAPRFYDAFERSVAEDLPEVAADLRAIQKAYGDMLAAASLDVATASVAYTGKPTALKAAAEAVQESGLSGALLRVADEAYRGVYDTNHPFNVWLREVQKRGKASTGKRLEMEAAENPYVLARQANHAFSVGLSDVTHGVTPYRGVDPEGPSLADVNRKAFGSKEPGEEMDARFGAYLISRRMVHEWARYERGELERAPDKPEHDRAFHERVIQDAERLHPTWAEAAEMANEWNRHHWRLWRDAGFLTETAYEAGLRNREFYVPLQRDVADKSKPGGRGRASGVGQFAGGAKTFEGSERDIIHPMISMVRTAFEARAAIARNEVVKSMRAAAEKAGPNTGDLLEELPAKVLEPVEVEALEALKAAVKALGLDPRDVAVLETFQTMEAESAIKATLFTQRNFSPRKDEAVVFEWTAGKATPYLLPDGWLGQKLLQAISGMTQDTRTLWEEVAAAGAQALRLGVTGVPEFALKTLLRDQLAAAILTDVGFIPFKDTAVGLADELGGSNVARRYQAAGGLMGGVNVAATRKPFPKNDAEAKAQLKQLRTRVVKNPRELARGLAHLVDIGDTATRIGVFRKALEAAKKRGLSDYQAVVEARHASADFFDPSRHGAWAGVRQIARTVPFFNSGLQGTDVLVRTVRHAFARPETLADKRAFRKAWWSLSMLGATSVLGLSLWAAHHDDPDWQNLNDQTRATGWPLLKTGDGEWLIYPKSFELGMPSNLTERLAQALLVGDAKVFERIRADLLNTVAPTREAPVLAIPFQAAQNRDYTGAPIIPEHLKGAVEPELQVNAWTSETAKLLAGNAMSPAVLEHYITGFLGSVGRDALKLGDMALGHVRGTPETAGRAPDLYLSRGYIRRTARGSDSEREFWRLAGQDGALERSYRSFASYLREGREDRAAQYLRGLDRQERAYVTSLAMLEGEARMAHPIYRAREMMGVLGDLRRESRTGQLLGVDGRVLNLTPQERRALDDALDDLGLAEANNALVATGSRGWEQRERVDTQPLYRRVVQANEQAAQALLARMIEKKVPPPGGPDQWETLRPVLDEADPDQLIQALSASMARRRMQGAGKQDEVRRQLYRAQTGLMTRPRPEAGSAGARVGMMTGG